MVDTYKHDSVFSSEKFGLTRIDVIGCGAVGSKVVMSLAKLGIKNINVWDFDTIVSHNIANQLFGISDIGLKKIIATKNIIFNTTGIEIKVNDKKVDGSEELGDIVFVLPDNMSSRKDIWDKAIKLKPKTKLMIEARMGIDNGRVYTIQPYMPNQIAEYEKTLYKDEDVVEASACGFTPSVGSTAGILADWCVWQLIRWFSIKNGREDNIENEIIFSTRPALIMSRYF